MTIIISTNTNTTTTNSSTALSTLSTALPMAQFNTEELLAEAKEALKTPALISFNVKMKLQKVDPVNAKMLVALLHRAYERPDQEKIKDVTAALAQFKILNSPGPLAALRDFLENRALAYARQGPGNMKQLTGLFILNDVAHYCHPHSAFVAWHPWFQECAKSLVRVAAANGPDSPVMMRKLGEIVEHWETQGFLDSGAQLTLRNILEDPRSEIAMLAPATSGKSKRETSFFNQPAGAMLWHIRRHPGQTVSTSALDKVFLEKKDPDDNIRLALAALKKQAGYAAKPYVHPKNDHVPADITRMGEPLGQIYYGWSINFARELEDGDPTVRPGWYWEAARDNTAYSSDGSRSSRSSRSGFGQ